jgi:hypothetical protein
MASVTGRVNEPLNNLQNYSKRWFVPIESEQSTRHVAFGNNFSVGRAAAILFFFVINQRFGNCERGVRTILQERSAPSIHDLLQTFRQSGSSISTKLDSEDDIE